MWTWGIFWSLKRAFFEREIQPHFRIFDSRRERRKHQNARERRVATIGERFVRVAVGIGRERKVCAFATRGDEISEFAFAFHGKAKTKWEQFAEEKGIKKRKRSKMVFDEQQDEWKRRHGYDRANDSTKIAIVEAKLSSLAGQTEDPFLKERKDKKARVEKNEMQRRRNLGEQVKEKGAAALPATLRLAIGAGSNNNSSGGGKKGGDNGGGVGAKSLKSKQLVKDVQYKVATSTASVGKFNAPIPGDEKIKARGKRRSFASNTDDKNTKAQEKAFVEKLIKREKSKKTSEGVDVGLAAKKMQKEQETEKREGKKQKLRGGGGGKQKK